MPIKRLPLSLICLVFLLNSCGCEAFVRKFTRKPKKENMPREELVLSPQEYEEEETDNPQEYRRYLLYWKSWQDELIDSLAPNGNHKKQVDCAQEALKNLNYMAGLIDKEARKGMEVYIEEMRRLIESIDEDKYGSRIDYSKYEAGRIRRNILRDFSYSRIKDKLL